MHKLSRQVNCCRKAVHNFHGMKTNVHVHKHLEVAVAHVRVTHYKQTQNNQQLLVKTGNAILNHKTR